MSFDAEHLRRTQLIMASLAEQSTIDELGFRLVDDLVSGVLHPGLTTQHTRAKYLLFVPEDYRILHGTSVEAMIAEGRVVEARRAKRLTSYYSDRSRENASSRGIIGARNAENTQQLASSFYWGLLRQLGILREGISISEYCARRVGASLQHQERAALHSEEDVAPYAFDPWLEIPTSKDFTGFELSGDEAEWLRSRFLQSDRSEEDSLTSWMLKQDRWWDGVGRSWQHPEFAQFPASSQVAIAAGLNIDRVLHGARILYNYLGAVRRPDPGQARDQLIERYAGMLRTWADREVHAPDWPNHEQLSAAYRWITMRMTELGSSHASRLRWELAFQFLMKWHEIADRSKDLASDEDAARIVTERESNLKPGRARLSRPELLRDWAGGAGLSHFNFHWSVAVRLVSDIHRGLNTPFLPVDGSV